MQAALLVEASIALGTALLVTQSTWARKRPQPLRQACQQHLSAKRKLLPTLGSNTQRCQCSTGWARQPR